MPLMISHKGPHSHTDNERPVQGNRIAFQITDCYQQIAFRIALRFLRYSIEFL